MNNRKFSERITIKSILLPSVCTNYSGVTTVDITSIDESRTVQQNPAKFDFIIYKGVSFNITFLYKDKNTQLPNDLTGFSVEGKAFLLNNNNTEFNLHPVIDDPKSGKITITLSADETNEIYLENCNTYYHYYLNLISNNEYVYRILMGNITICQ